MSIFGCGRDRMPDWAFRTMALSFRIRDRFVRKDAILDEFGIRPGMTVVDYGCGPGSYIRKASGLAGADGRVCAVDIHELAVEAVRERIAGENLTNVSALLAAREGCPLEDGSADIVYALDMFHMVADPSEFLKELRRISKKDGVLFIDSGHQGRDQARAKIGASGAWAVVEEHPRYFKCRPA